MKILYLSSSYVPSRRASSVQVMKMCSALAGRGHDVELITKLTPTRLEPGEDPFAFYGIDADSFRISPLIRPRFRGGGIIFAASVRRHLRLRADWCDIAFCRDPVAARLATGLGIPALFEAHGVPSNWVERRLLRKTLASRPFRGLVTISQALADRLRSQRLIAPEVPLLIAPDGADAAPAHMEAGSGGRARRAAASEVQLGYVGHLYPGRGLGLLRSIASQLPESTLHVVGGTEEAIGEHKKTAPPNMIFHGFVPPASLGRYYRMFDVLLMPYQNRVGVASGSANTVDWMSPMKMFEYMATGKPIVSSDLPVLREVLSHGRNALLLPAADAKAWIGAIRDLHASPELRRELGSQARSDLLENYTWDIRARRIEEFVGDSSASRHEDSSQNRSR